MAQGLATRPDPRPIPNVLNVSWQNPLAKPKLAAKESIKARGKPPTTVRDRPSSVLKDQARRRGVG
jgi:hypothetical protein